MYVNNAHWWDTSSHQLLYANIIHSCYPIYFSNVKINVCFHHMYNSMFEILKSWLEHYVCTRVKTMFNASSKHNTSYANHIQRASFHVPCQYLLFLNVMRNLLSFKPFWSRDSSDDLEMVKNRNLHCGRKYIYVFQLSFGGVLREAQAALLKSAFRGT